MDKFDEWYDAQPGVKDRDLARKAFEAGRESLLNGDAVKIARQMVNATDCVYSSLEWRRALAGLLPEGDRNA
jgi:hypothetical protein